MGYKLGRCLRGDNHLDIPLSMFLPPTRSDETKRAVESYNYLQLAGLDIALSHFALNKVLFELLR